MYSVPENYEDFKRFQNFNILGWCLPGLKLSNIIASQKLKIY